MLEILGADGGSGLASRPLHALTLRLLQVLLETREVQSASQNHPKEKQGPLQGSSHEAAEPHMPSRPALCACLPYGFHQQDASWSDQFGCHCNTGSAGSVLPRKFGLLPPCVTCNLCPVAATCGRSHIQQWASQPSREDLSGEPWLALGWMRSTGPELTGPFPVL